MKISIFGTGYVGLVTGTCLAEHGHEVLCVDVDEKKIEQLQNGNIPIYEPGLAELVHRNTKEGRLQFTLDAKVGIQFGDVVFNAVGTPPDKNDNNKADLRYIKQVAQSFGEYIDTSKLLVNKSTVPVGTADLCHSIIAEELTKRGVDIWYEVVSNPEFLREGAAIKDFMNPDRVVCGVSSEQAKDLMRQVYEPIMRSYRNVFFTDQKSAEIIKYASNAFLATKISFINEIANFSEKVGANISDIARGVGMDKRIGPKFLHAGIGYGGSCFPKDVKALIASGEEKGYDFSIIKATEDVNQQQKLLPLQKLTQHFSSLKEKTVAILGLAFKPKTDDIREAPSIQIVDKLMKQGVGKLQLFDPVARDNFGTHYPPSQQVIYATTAYDAIQSSDAVLLLTDWDEFRGIDFGKMKSMMRGNVIVDGRNIWDKKKLGDLGFVYEGIGR